MTHKTFDIEKIRDDFPILNKKIYGYPLIYFDNAATTQKPKVVIDALYEFYKSDNANVHRSIYQLSEAATLAYENARQKIADFIHAEKSKECIFVRGTTEAINLVAHGFYENQFKAGDEIIISQIEHHSNIVPWQWICEQRNVKLNVIPCNLKGELDIEAFQNMLNEKTKLVAVTHVSNALGTINPLKRLIQLAHLNDTPILIDGAQACAHCPIDVKALDCDFYAFSAHKMYGPTGIGILYGKDHWLERLPPYQRGGEMISSVSFEKTIFAELPHKFEAGTPAIAEAIVFKSAIEYIESIGIENIAKHEQHLLEYANRQLSNLPELRFIGTAADKTPIIAFTLADIHPHDIATALDRRGIAVRSGQLCAQPAVERFGLKALTRASLALYNTFEEIDQFVDALKETYHFFKK